MKHELSFCVCFDDVTRSKIGGYMHPSRLLFTTPYLLGTRVLVISYRNRRYSASRYCV